MIVCSCNVLSENDVREACASLAPRTPGQVYRCLGCSPQCGRCSRTIKTILDQALAACPAACAICPAGEHQHAPAANDELDLVEITPAEAAE